MTIPDNWVILKIKMEDGSNLYKILAGWHGGYMYGDSWRLNSGIASVGYENDYYLFHGASGSVYHCHKDSEGLSMVTDGILRQLQSVHPDRVLMIQYEDFINEFEG